MLWKLIREEQPEYLGITLDPPGPTFRDKLFTEYKATRTAMPDDLARQLPYVRRLFEALRTPVIEVPGYEADDVLATLVEQALRTTDLDIVAVSGAKDLLQLVGPRVRALSVLRSTGEKVLYDVAKVRERRAGVERGGLAAARRSLAARRGRARGGRGGGGGGGSTLVPAAAAHRRDRPVPSGRGRGVDDRRAVARRAPADRARRQAAAGG